MKRVNYVIANWKMNGLRSHRKLYNSINKHLVSKKSNKPNVIICPPHTLIHTLALEKKSKVKLGAQDAHQHNSGAFTGESDALRTAQARAMGETASDAGLFQTDRGYNRLANVVKMGQGLAGEVQDSYMDLGKNQLSALETQAEKDFSKSASLQKWYA